MLIFKASPFPGTYLKNDQYNIIIMTGRELNQSIHVQVHYRFNLHIQETRLFQMTFCEWSMICCYRTLEISIVENSKYRALLASCRVNMQWATPALLHAAFAHKVISWSCSSQQNWLGVHAWYNIIIGGVMIGGIFKRCLRKIDNYPMGSTNLSNIHGIRICEHVAWNQEAPCNNRQT